MVIVGTHCDKLRSDDREQKKAEMNNIIYQRFLVGRGPQQLREMGLPKILDVIYVGCPSTGRLEGVQELRMALYDIAFSLTLPGKGEGEVSHVCADGGVRTVKTNCQSLCYLELVASVLLENKSAPYTICHCLI